MWPSPSLYWDQSSLPLSNSSILPKVTAMAYCELPSSPVNVASWYCSTQVYSYKHRITWEELLMDNGLYTIALHHITSQFHNPCTNKNIRINSYKSTQTLQCLFPFTENVTLPRISTLSWSKPHPQGRSQTWIYLSWILRHACLPCFYY